MNRIDRIRATLERALRPVALEIIDDSHLHAGHAGAAGGAGHYTVKVVAEAFEGKSQVARHRMVYGAVGELMGPEIHALSISARTPAEATSHPAPAPPAG